MKQCFLPSVNRPIDPFGLFTLTCEIPIGKQFFRMRNTPTENTVHQRTGQDSLYDYPSRMETSAMVFLPLIT